MLIHDPNTGAYIDNTTGQVFLDAQGSRLSTNPDINSQAQRNLEIANKMFANLGADRAKYAQVFSDQAELSRALDNTIRGTAPSVAGTQLAAGVEAGTRAAESMAAGASGANAPAARIAAIQSGGQQSAEANAAAATLRAQEVAEAERTKAQVLHSAGTLATQNAGISATAATGAGQNAAHTGETQAAIDQKNKEAWMNLTANLINGGGNALALYGSRR